MEKERGIHCLATGMGWLYEWASNGMLKKVIRPDGRPVEFRYDALGRRTAKQYFGKVTRWVWNGNVPLHEWCYKVAETQWDEEENIPPKEPAEDVTTWVFEADTFVPTAKIRGDKQYSIVSDYMGTPIQMYDGRGNKIWDCTLDIYGKVIAVDKGTEFDCPFRFQGQYADEETGLYYNRFRYYDSLMSCYLSQDPIRLAGSNLIFYEYVHNTNVWIDILGLRPLGHGIGDVGEKAVIKTLKNQGYDIINVKYGSNNGIDILAQNPTTGKYDVFEVKSSMKGNFTFSEDQLDSDSFVSTRLENAKYHKKLTQEKYDEIIANLGDKKVAYVNVKRAGNKKLYADSINFKDWDTEANKIKGGHH